LAASFWDFQTRNALLYKETIVEQHKNFVFEIYELQLGFKKKKSATFL